MDSSILLEHSTTPLEAGFKALSDPARLRILDLLSSGSRCVCELEVEMSCASNLLAYHLGLLKQAGFVEGTKEGRRTHYRIIPDAFQALCGELDRLAGQSK
jgi:ArsR family transcriptional regulator, arsenate/arsenite/antimonite-responsive transcriptional repressor